MVSLIENLERRSKTGREVEGKVSPYLFELLWIFEL